MSSPISSDDSDASGNSDNDDVLLYKRRARYNLHAGGVVSSSSAFAGDGSRGLSTKGSKDFRQRTSIVGGSPSSPSGDDSSSPSSSDSSLSTSSSSSSSSGSPSNPSSSGSYASAGFSDVSLFSSPPALGGGDHQNRDQDNNELSSASSSEEEQGEPSDVEYVGEDSPGSEDDSPLRVPVETRLDRDGLELSRREFVRLHGKHADWQREAIPLYATRVSPDGNLLHYHEYLELYGLEAWSKWWKSPLDHERRTALDGNNYGKRAFHEWYGDRAGKLWSLAPRPYEKRVDSFARVRTKSQFIRRFGAELGNFEWDRAPQANYRRVAPDGRRLTLQLFVHNFGRLNGNRFWHAAPRPWHRRASRSRSSSHDGTSMGYVGSADQNMMDQYNNAPPQVLSTVPLNATPPAATMLVPVVVNITLLDASAFGSFHLGSGSFLPNWGIPFAAVNASTSSYLWDNNSAVNSVQNSAEVQGSLQHVEESTTAGEDHFPRSSPSSQPQVLEQDEAGPHQQVSHEHASTAAPVRRSVDTTTQTDHGQGFFTRFAVTEDDLVDEVEGFLYDVDSVRAGDDSAVDYYAPGAIMTVGFDNFEDSSLHFYRRHDAHEDHEDEDAHEEGNNENVENEEGNKNENTNMNMITEDTSTTRNVEEQVDQEDEVVEHRENTALQKEDRRVDYLEGYVPLLATSTSSLASLVPESSADDARFDESGDLEGDKKQVRDGETNFEANSNGPSIEGRKPRRGDVSASSSGSSTPRINERLQEEALAAAAGIATHNDVEEQTHDGEQDHDVEAATSSSKKASPASSSDDRQYLRSSEAWEADRQELADRFRRLLMIDSDFAFAAIGSASSISSSSSNLASSSITDDGAEANTGSATAFLETASSSSTEARSAILDQITTTTSSVTSSSSSSSDSINANPYRALAMSDKDEDLDMFAPPTADELERLLATTPSGDLNGAFTRAVEYERERTRAAESDRWEAMSATSLAEVAQSEKDEEYFREYHLTLNVENYGDDIFQLGEHDDYHGDHHHEDSAAVSDGTSASMIGTTASEQEQMKVKTEVGQDQKDAADLLSSIFRSVSSAGEEQAVDAEGDEHFQHGPGELEFDDSELREEDALVRAIMSSSSSAGASSADTERDADDDNLLSDDMQGGGFQSLNDYLSMARLVMEQMRFPFQPPAEAARELLEDAAALVEDVRSFGQGVALRLSTSVSEAEQIAPRAANALSKKISAAAMGHLNPLTLMMSKRMEFEAASSHDFEELADTPNAQSSSAFGPPSPPSMLLDTPNLHRGEEVAAISSPEPEYLEQRGESVEPPPSSSSSSASSSSSSQTLFMFSSSPIANSFTDAVHSFARNGADSFRQSMGQLKEATGGIQRLVCNNGNLELVTGLAPASPDTTSQLTMQLVRLEDLMTTAIKDISKSSVVRNIGRPVIKFLTADARAQMRVDESASRSRAARIASVFDAYKAAVDEKRRGQRSLQLVVAQLEKAGRWNRLVRALLKDNQRLVEARKHAVIDALKVQRLRHIRNGMQKRQEQLQTRAQPGDGNASSEEMTTTTTTSMLDTSSAGGRGSTPVLSSNVTRRTGTTGRGEPLRASTPTFTRGEAHDSWNFYRRNFYSGAASTTTTQAQDTGSEDVSNGNSEDDDSTSTTTSDMTTSKGITDTDSADAIPDTGMPSTTTRRRFSMPEPNRGSSFLSFAESPSVASWFQPFRVTPLKTSTSVAVGSEGASASSPEGSRPDHEVEITTTTSSSTRTSPASTDGPPPASQEGTDDNVYFNRKPSVVSSIRPRQHASVGSQEDIFRAKDETLTPLPVANWRHVHARNKAYMPRSETRLQQRASPVLGLNKLQHKKNFMHHDHVVSPRLLRARIMRDSIVQSLVDLSEQRSKLLAMVRFTLLTQSNDSVGNRRAAENYDFLMRHWAQFLRAGKSSFQSRQTRPANKVEKITMFKGKEEKMKMIKDIQDGGKDAKDASSSSAPAATAAANGASKEEDNTGAEMDATAASTSSTTTTRDAVSLLLPTSRERDSSSTSGTTSRSTGDTLGIVAQSNTLALAETPLQEVLFMLGQRSGSPPSDRDDDAVSVSSQTSSSDDHDASTGTSPSTSSARGDTGLAPEDSLFWRYACSGALCVTVALVAGILLCGRVCSPRLGSKKGSFFGGRRGDSDDSQVLGTAVGVLGSSSALGGAATAARAFGGIIATRATATTCNGLVDVYDLDDDEEKDGYLEDSEGEAAA
ncbi:unnamed protein product [Amoebophrya sp. A25]|nr:unnamed protein product [Amoebophrya sp. A25]|eukprot:GSA25T00018825001.1